MSDEVDLNAAMEAVVRDMGEAALRFKAKRFESKEAPQKERAPEAPAAEPEGGATLSELESMLNGG